MLLFIESLPGCAHVSCTVMPDSAIPRTVVCQTPLPVGFSRQKCWSGLPFPSPGDLPHPGIEFGSLKLQVDSLPSEPPWKFQVYLCGGCKKMTNFLWTIFLGFP